MSDVVMRPTRINVYGQCENYTPHEAHLFPNVMQNDGVIGMQSCPGQYSDCRNCDDRKCMACVFREWHDECEESCPFCCGPEAERETYI